jgi:hypothetical protein
MVPVTGVLWLIILSVLVLGEVLDRDLLSGVRQVVPSEKTLLFGVVPCHEDVIICLFWNPK